MNTTLFEGSDDMSSSVLEEESALLFSTTARNPAESRVSDSFDDASLESLSDDPTRVRLFDSPASRASESEALPGTAGVLSPVAEQSVSVKEINPLIGRLRRELALRRREDTVLPTTRRPRLEKKASRGVSAPVVFERTPIRKKTPTAASIHIAPSAASQVSERRVVSSDSSSSRSFLGKVYGVPVLGYCVELFVHFFRLPTVVREMRVLSTRKDAVVQARLDGIGNRIAALREGASLCRREMEEVLSGKADTGTLAALSGDVSQKVDSERFDTFTLHLEAELSRKVAVESLEYLKASWEATLSELREELSGKAGEDRLDALEEKLRTKTDAELARMLEERLDHLVERLGTLEGNSALERLESLESKISLKADLEEMNSQLLTKLEADALKTWEKRLEDASTDLLATVSKKADAERVETLASSLELKADAEAVESLSASKADSEVIRSLRESLDVLTSKTDELGDAFESRLSSKADLEALHPVAERLESVIDRLGAIEGDTVLERLGSVESALELKADLEIVKSLLSLKIDVELLKTHGKNLDVASDEALAILEKKADAASVEALMSSLKLKADAESLKSLTDDLSSVAARLGDLDSKADAAEVRSLVEQLDLLNRRIRELDLKAEAETVRTLGERLESVSEHLKLLDSKADKERIDSLEVRMDLKADVEVTKSLEERLNTTSSVLEAKADAETIISISKELNGRLASKADSAAVDKVLAMKAGKDDLDGVQRSIGSELSDMQRRLEERSERTSDEERKLARFRDEVKALIASSLEHGARAELEERFRANFPYVQKMKERSAAFRGSEDGTLKKQSKARSDLGPGVTKSRKRVKR